MYLLFHQFCIFNQLVFPYAFKELLLFKYINSSACVELIMLTLVVQVLKTNQQLIDCVNGS